MRRLDAKALTSLADEMGLGVGEEEAKVFCEAIALLEKGMAELADMKEDRPPVRQTVRDPGCRPGPAEDPLNCFLRKCFVKGADEGPLHGKRLGLKDHISVAGVPMTLGSRFMEGYIPEIDATVVTRLLAAGADVVAKLNMDDFSHGSHGFGTGLGDYGRPRNPHNPDHVSGGSSSGSAVALASGAVDLAIGGDQGGSIRIPSAWCGVVGLNPTHGLVPHTGVVGFEPTIDFIGPMARTVEDVAQMLECIAGPDGYDPRQVGVPPVPRYTEDLDKGISGVRIGVLREGFGDPEAEPDVDGAVREAIAVLRRAGATLQEISVPDHLRVGKLIGPIALVGGGLALRTYGGAFLQGYYDTHFAQVFASFLKSKAHQLPFRAKLSLLLGGYLGAEGMVYYGKAQNIRRLFRKAYDAAFAEVDCLVMPTVPIKAPRYIPPRDYAEALHRTIVRKQLRVVTRNTSPFNITGHPALSIPCAMSEGLPIGMMIVGPHFSESLLLRAGYAFEQSVNWDQFRPAAG